MSELPELYTARLFAREVLASGEVVPVDVAFRPPTIPLSYDLEERAEALVPHPEHLGEWAQLSTELCLPALLEGPGTVRAPGR